MAQNLFGSGPVRTAFFAIFSLASLGAVTSAFGQRPGDSASGTALRDTLPHRHRPVILNSRPIVSPVDVSLVRPRRILWKEDGTIYVADWDAGRVLRVSPAGRVTIVAEELDQPSGLALDSAGNLYISTFAQGMSKEGTVVRIGTDGMKTVFAVGLSGAADLAIDSNDNLYVAGFSDNTIYRVSSMGEVTTFVTNISGPSALLLDTEGELLALSSSEGALYRIDGMGDVVRIAGGLVAPSDLVLHPQGHVIAVDFGHRRLMHVTPKGKLQLFALVPAGTVAAAFDTHGNLLLTNGDDGTLLKITSHLTIRCPHCGRPIPLHLRSRSVKPPTESEEKPVKPIL